MKAKVDNVLDSITRAGLLSPKTITLMITNRCNLSCSHCLTESCSNDIGRPIPTDAIKRLIEEFIRLGVKEVCLTGGEPLLHPDWFEILSFACRKKGLTRICLQTNGTLLTEDDIAAFCTHDFKNLTIQVSMDGATPETHDKVRGAGSFEKTVKNLKLLSNAYLGPQVVVAFTEMQHNFTELPDLIFLVNELGIASLVSGTLVQAGRAVRTDQTAPPTPSQYIKLLNRYHSDQQFKSLYEKVGNIAAIEWFIGKAFPSTVFCNCMEKPYISSNGDMYPCLMLAIEKLAVKNIYQRPLEESLLEGLFLWSELAGLHYKRSVALEKCRDCPGRRHCAGGCMGRAFAVNGDCMTVEDRCVLRRAVYDWKP